VLAQKWGIVICDEAHNLQTETAQCSKVVWKLRQTLDHGRWILLTATPCDKPSYYGLLRLVEPEIFQYYWHHKPANIKYPRHTDKFYFAEWYALPEIVYIAGGKPRWEMRRMVRRNELHALTSYFVLRQEKREVLNDIAPLCLQKVTLGTATPEQKAAFDRKMARVTDTKQERGGHVMAKAMLLEQVRETASQKLPLVIDYINKLLQINDHGKFIVWAYHKVIMQGLSEALDKQGVEHITVNGDTPLQQRESLFYQLKTDPKTRVGILSLDACGTGLNFAFLQLTIYAELTFRYKSHIQSEGRCYRIGQKGEAIAQYLMFADSTDDLVWNSLARKRDNESVLLKGERAESVAQTLTIQEAIDFVATHSLPPPPPEESEVKIAEERKEVWQDEEFSKALKRFEEAADLEKEEKTSRVFGDFGLAAYMV